MKDATVSVRVETKIKEEAEDILQNLGIPVSVVINTLYRQIVYHRGIPFALTLPERPKAEDEMADTELYTKLKHSYEQSLAGKGRTVDDVFDDLEGSLR
jgi:addiction module RelB/DinJ family antitoxin